MVSCRKKKLKTVHINFLTLSDGVLFQRPFDWIQKGETSVSPVGILFSEEGTSPEETLKRNEPSFRFSEARPTLCVRHAWLHSTAG